MRTILILLAGIVIPASAVAAEDPYETALRNSGLRHVASIARCARLPTGAALCRERAHDALHRALIRADAARAVMQAEQRIVVAEKMARPR